MRLVNGLLLGLCLLGSVAWADNISEFTLQNGLRVLIKEDHRVPVALTMVWYKIGSAYETSGITGISHVLEHMMFKGTKKRGPGELAKLINEVGGVQNAFTDTDFTVYFTEVSKDHLPLVFDLEADRMQDLVLSEKEFKKEIEVVKEERMMRVEDNPQMRTFERFIAAAYLNTGYHHTPIGWLSDINNMTVADLRDWYQRWYGPNNATLVVVGDVTPDEIKPLAEQYFAAIKPITVTALKPLPEPPFLSARNVAVSVQAKMPWVVMGYNVPGLTTATDSKEMYALDVLADILGAGESSRLSRELVRKKELVSSASASYDPFTLLSTIFILEATPSQAHTSAEVKSAFLAQIKALQDKPVTETELTRVKNQIIAQKVFGRDSLSGQGMQLGALATVGLPVALADSYADHIRAVTAQQVQAVARKYLVPERLTVGELKPLPIPPGTLIQMNQNPLGGQNVH